MSLVGMHYEVADLGSNLVNMEISIQTGFMLAILHSTGEDCPCLAPAAIWSSVDGLEYAAQAVSFPNWP